MSAESIAMMVFSIAVLWGGLAAAVVHLGRATPEGPALDVHHVDPDAVRDHTL
ncbi:methionine/alanine import family NSS transporter small subunit [Nocardioides yefusunii]|uniref:Methionine/alanine import family NSS transporter small subunit n=1 Tax=Nocardioides yefusunii TaxID=2500546 RepID=A0ABW1R1L9_9ACTN|nr:methionine/alanine import family NSS transporter small subunit [Nocardioides yefusunii]